MSLTFEDQPNEHIEKVEIDFEKRTIESREDENRDTEMYAVEAVDQAELCFFILQGDVSFIKPEGARTEAYVQAKLFAIDDDDINSNGLGVVETTVVLYDVSS